MDINCKKCGYWRGKPNTLDKKRLVSIFICSNCKSGYDDREEREERRLGA